MPIHRIKQSKDSVVSTIKTSIWAFRIYYQISKPLVITVLVTNFILSFQGMATAFLTGYLLDAIISAVNTGTQGLQLLLPLIGAYVVIGVIFGTVRLLLNYCERILSHKERMALRRLLFERLKELGIPKLENNEITNKSQRFEETMQDISTIVQMTVTFIALVVTAISYIVVMYTKLPIIIPILLILFIVKLFLNQNYMSKLNKLFIESTESRRIAMETASVLSNPTPLKEIVSIGAFPYLKSKFEDFVYVYIRNLKRIRQRWLVAILTMDIASAVVFFWGILQILSRILQGRESIGSFAFQVALLRGLNDSFESITYRVANIRDISLRLTDIRDLFTKVETDADGLVALKKLHTPPQIDIINLSFKYENSPQNVLQSINLTIKSGEKIAIVGENGAGKTTLVKLISRVYRPTEGAIFINDTNLNSLKLTSWHNNLGVLHQDFNKYHFLTARENVIIGDIRKRATTERIERALTSAEAREFINSFPIGLDQILSERYQDGIRPSTGQWQKIALARFFYRNSPVLIFDEPTASIDAQSEAEIFNRIYKFMEKKTVIIISHRFSTVRNADRIIVLDKGRIIEEGTHDQLLKKNGKYAKAFKLQAKGYE